MPANFMDDEKTDVKKLGRVRWRYVLHGLVTVLALGFIDWKVYRWAYPLKFDHEYLLGYLQV